ncbi:MAG TPA: hypothetical protein VH583_23380 [Vicinamibacterales bacterium]|jgi:plasmid stability protein
MPDILVRGLDAEVIAQLKAAAKMHGRSLQAEIHDILENAGAMSLAETRRISARWLKRLRLPGGAVHTDSTAAVRDDRTR